MNKTSKTIISILAIALLVCVFFNVRQESTKEIAYLTYVAEGPQETVYDSRGVVHTKGGEYRFCSCGRIFLDEDELLDITTRGNNSFSFCPKCEKMLVIKH